MLPHFRRIARKIFGYKQQKAHKKHRHAPNTACPLLCRLFTPPIQQTNTPPPYFHLPRRTFPPPPAFCTLFSLHKQPIQTIYPTSAPRALAPSGLSHLRLTTPFFCALFSLHKQPIQTIYPPNAARRLPPPRRAFPHRNPPISAPAFSATTFHRLYLNIIK